MNPESFFHVAIKTNDLHESSTFYQDQFDAEVIEHSLPEEGEGANAVEHIALRIADKRVYLFDRAPYEAAGLVETVPPGFLHFGFVVEDVDDACEQLSAMDVEFIMEPTVFGSLKIAFFTDPSDVRIELLEHLG